MHREPLHPFAPFGLPLSARVGIGKKNCLDFSDLAGELQPPHASSCLGASASSAAWPVLYALAGSLPASPVSLTSPARDNNVQDNFNDAVGVSSCEPENRFHCWIDQLDETVNNFED